MNIHNISPELLQAIQNGLPNNKLIELAPGATMAEKAGNVAWLMQGIKNGIISTAMMPGAKKSNGPVVQVQTTKPRLASPSPYSTRGKITNVVVCDLHIPLHREDLLEYISQRYEGGRLIIGGDVKNNSNHSSFDTINSNLNRFKEWKLLDEDIDEMTIELFAKLSPYWKEIILIRGNHDYRAVRSKSKSAHGDVSRAERAFEDELAREVRNVTIHTRCWDDYYSAKIGDAWIGHWPYYGQTPCFGGRKVVDIFLSNSYIKAQGECRVVMQGHTHKASDCMYKGIWTVEPGAMCVTPDYTTQSGKGGEPQLGYAVIVQEDGHTNHRESYSVKFGMEDHLYYTDGSSIYAHIA